MTDLPIFLVQHELTTAADERAIKRAYAKSLKQIDQENDLAGFQALRESYEEALEWTRLNRKSMDFLAQEKSEPARVLIPGKEKILISPALAEEDILNEFKREQKNESVTIPGTDTKHKAKSPQSAEKQADLAFSWMKGSLPTADSEKIAQRLFDELLQELKKQTNVSGNAEECLLRIMDDGRPISIWVRHEFEYRIATYVTEGWHIGDGDLLDAAIKCFAWDKRKQDLNNFGPVGEVLNKALMERESFLSKDQKNREKLWMILQKVREDGNPDSKFLKANFDLLVRMVQSYPMWIYMVTNRKNLSQWYVIVNSKHKEAAAEYLQEKHKINTSHEIKDRLGAIATILFLLIVVFIAGKTYQKTRPTPSVSPASNIQKVVIL
ncbi:hypothetical protein [Undibacterium sp. TJN19]|uniref:hypothetical protein n=1 Tax=Undibacterium sp. TJN19 TaxID=3413055 RepID=UPI003BF1939F